jgi:hypothetical protein
MDKPLFIPLKTEYFDAFASGVKSIEYRQFGPRWNEKTCLIRRPVVLSCGYGKGRRLYGVITAFEIKNWLEVEETRSIYCFPCMIACIHIKLERENGEGPGEMAWPFPE